MSTLEEMACALTPPDEMDDQTVMAMLALLGAGVHQYRAIEGRIGKWCACTWAKDNYYPSKVPDEGVKDTAMDAARYYLNKIARREGTPPASTGV